MLELLDGWVTSIGLMVYIVKPAMKRIIIVVLLLLVIAACQKESRPELPVDPVLSHDELDSVFASIEVVDFSELPSNFVNYCELNGQFYEQYTGTKWLRIGRLDLKKNFAGNFQLWELIPKDSCYQNCCFRGGDTYFLFDTRIAHKLLYLLLIMEERGLNTRELSIYHGFRHPAYNEEVGGASRSQHLFGRAIDIRPGDVDGDGDIDREDKKAIVDILDKEVIGDEGGIGDYHHSMGIHMDVRGYKARWDRQ